MLRATPTFDKTALRTAHLSGRALQAADRPAGVCSTSLAGSGSAFVPCAKRQGHLPALYPPCLLLHLKPLAYPLSETEMVQGRRRLANRQLWSGVAPASSESSSALPSPRSPSETSPTACSMAYAARLVLLVTVVSALAGRSGTCIGSMASIFLVSSSNRF
jgi:hypothetical protein